MVLKLYNTLTRKKEIFKPINKNKINLFVCGPTVYDFSHIGHAKTYVQFDIIVKYLNYKKYKVFYLQNITDLDDKIIKRANELEINPLKLAKKYEEEYYKDIKKLKIDSVTKYARATDYIKEIISQVERLIKKNYAYRIEDGIYFNLKKFKEYGKLSKRTMEKAEDAVSRIDEGINKKNKGDFCLWKFSKQNEPAWPSKFKKGRPGWHIEDTAITENFFGPQYDIHGGAIDLIFPHHEAEIAQMESISGKKPLVRYWLHTGFLNVEGKKMSKSLHNFITIKEALKKYSPELLRFFFTSTHYRSPIDFIEKSLNKLKNTLERLNEFTLKLKNKKDTKETEKIIKKYKERFLSSMDDDFNTPKALACLFEFMKEINKKGGGKKAYRFMLEIDSIFNILNLKEEKIPQEILKLTKQREKERKDKNFKEADEIRKKIELKGYYIEDTKKGPLIRKTK